MLAFSDIGEKYSGITNNDLRVKYLKKEHLNVSHKVENVKALWLKYGVTILSDGWIDTSKRALVNIFVSCYYGTMYLKTIDCNLVFLQTTIKEVKVENVVPKLSQIMHLIVLAWVATFQRLNSQALYGLLVHHIVRFIARGYWEVELGS